MRISSVTSLFAIAGGGFALSLALTLLLVRGFPAYSFGLRWPVITFGVLACLVSFKKRRVDFDTYADPLKRSGGSFAKHADEVSIAVSSAKHSANSFVHSPEARRLALITSLGLTTPILWIVAAPLLRIFASAAYSWDGFTIETGYRVSESREVSAFFETQGQYASVLFLLLTPTLFWSTRARDGWRLKFFVWYAFIQIGQLFAFAY